MGISVLISNWVWTLMPDFVLLIGPNHTMTGIRLLLLNQKHKKLRSNRTLCQFAFVEPGLPCDRQKIQIRDNLLAY